MQAVNRGYETRRLGETGNIPFRSERFFTIADQWYFSTREGFDSGPYTNKERASEGLKRFLKVVTLIPAADEFKRASHRLY